MLLQKQVLLKKERRMDKISMIFVVVMIFAMIVLGLISLKAEPEEKDGKVRRRIKDRLAGFKPLVLFITFAVSLTAWIQADIGLLKIPAIIGKDFLTVSLWLSVRAVSAILSTLALLVIFEFTRRVKLVYIFCNYTPKRYICRKDRQGIRFVRIKHRIR